MVHYGSGRTKLLRALIYVLSRISSVLHGVVMMRRDILRGLCGVDAAHRAFEREMRRSPPPPFKKGGEKEASIELHAFSN